jgi:hypothetical protein
MSKGGSGGGTQQVEQTTSNLPEYARPYFEELLGRTAYESTRPYEAYPGQRIADFTPYEQMGMQGMYDMAAQGAPAQVGMASDIAAQIGYQPSNMGMQIACWLSATASSVLLYPGSISNRIPSWADISSVPSKPVLLTVRRKTV